jgi:hypothetical protein
VISEIRPLAAGNALQLSLVPPAGATHWRILRKGDAVFSGPDDAAALNVYEGDDTTVVDAMPGLINEMPCGYVAYFWVAAAWVASNVALGTPRATYADLSTDVLSLLRDRLEAGLAEEVRRGTFRLGEGRTIMEVFTAPPVIGQVEPPLVTVHLETEQPGARGIGELVAPDELLEDDDIREHEGWLADVSVEVLAWSLNPDERVELRKALRRIVVANLPVFSAAGMEQINFTQRDAEFLNGEFGPNPVYQAACSFTCMAPVIVSTNTFGKVREVDVAAAADRPPSP